MPSSVAKRKRKRTPFGQHRGKTSSGISKMETTMNKITYKAVQEETNSIATSIRLNPSMKYKRPPLKNKSMKTIKGPRRKDRS